MCGVLHPHSHNHGHGHSHGKDKGQDNLPVQNSSINVTLDDYSDSKSGQKRKFWQRKKHHHKHGSEENINVRAAFIHVIGDLIQSIGVVIAGYIIKFKVGIGSSFMQWPLSKVNIASIDPGFPPCAKILVKRGKGVLYVSVRNYDNRLQLSLSPISPPLLKCVAISVLSLFFLLY